jgi:hypothetical protein
VIEENTVAIKEWEAMVDEQVNRMTSLAANIEHINEAAAMLGFA